MQIHFFSTQLNPPLPIPSSITSWLKGSCLESLIQRIQALLHENQYLIFWTKTSTLFVTAPGLFLASVSLGVVIASQNHFGLREKWMKHLDLETTDSIISSIAFLCSLLFQYHLQYLWGGLNAGSHLYRLWTGQVYGPQLSGMKAFDRELHLLTQEIGCWVE